MCGHAAQSSHRPPKEEDGRRYTKIQSRRAPPKIQQTPATNQTNPRRASRKRKTETSVVVLFLKTLFFFG